ncbi:MAG: DNA-processing protein DprA [Candidatus Polarisedimenticolaceae bacterium]|nr:DNA-processing protein DprA [Candidatus Polarisedimenticolaceae bacterium]
MPATASHRSRSDTKACWLALLRTPGLGSRGIGQLLEQVSEISTLFEATPHIPENLTLKPKVREQLRRPDWSLVEQDLAWLEQPDNHLVTLQDPEYPTLLRETADPPAALFVHGDPALLASPQIAMVGSRNPSVSGKSTAKEFARYLAGAGITITSGLAIGIDGASHQGALAAHGTTIAVMGTGLDRVYPASHHGLAKQIVQQGGALVTEFPPGTPARAGHFPRRNRIISGLSLGVLVVEAALRSGSLITARQATEQGREVFAIPGSIHNPLARGCHAIIRQGAKLVETAQDIVEELGPLLHTLIPNEEPGTQTSAPENRFEMDVEYCQLLESIGYDPLPINEIIAQSGLTAEAVSSMLLLLELEGYVSSAPGGCFSRSGKA